MTKALRLDREQIEVLDEKVAASLRAKTGPERLNMVWDAWSFFEQRIRLHLKTAHPEWADEQIRQEIVKRVSYGTK